MVTGQRSRPRRHVYHMRLPGVTRRGNVILSQFLKGNTDSIQSRLLYPQPANQEQTQQSPRWWAFLSSDPLVRCHQTLAVEQSRVHGTHFRKPSKRNGMSRSLAWRWASTLFLLDRGGMLCWWHSGPEPFTRASNSSVCLKIINSPPIGSEGRESEKRCQKL